MKIRFRWWILLFVLLCINGWILVNRNKGYKYYSYRTYNDLYTTDSSLYLKGIQFSESLLHLKFSMALDSSLKLYTDSIFSRELKPAGNNLLLPLKNGFHTYKLLAANNVNDLSISISVDHAMHSDNSYDNEFVSASIAGPDVDPIPLDTWRFDKNLFEKDEVKQGIQLLDGPIGIKSVDNDTTKIIKIGMYLRHLPNDPKGRSSAATAGLTPWGMIKLAQQSTAYFNCGNYAAMFYFLGGLAGLVTRGITYSGPDGNWHYPAHFMNEVYLHNKHQWGLVDNLYNIYLPHDSTRFYNAADVKKMSDVNGFSDKLCYNLSNDTLQTVPYNLVSHFHKYYNLSDADVTYAHSSSYKISWFNNMWQFYIPIRDRDFYSDRKANNTAKLITKTISILGLILCSFAYMAWELRQKKIKHTNT